MPERRDIRVTVLDVEQYHGSDWPPEAPSEFMAWWQSKIDQIPEEYRESAEIEISSRSEYDSYHACLEITYWRPETDEEMRKRIEDAAHAETARELRERLAYEKLKAKFERS